MNYNSNNEIRQWSEQVINVMKPNGQIDTKNPMEILKEYLELLKCVEHQLQEIWTTQISKRNQTQ